MFFTGFINVYDDRPNAQFLDTARNGNYGRLHVDFADHGCDRQIHCCRYGYVTGASDLLPVLFSARVDLTAFTFHFA